MWVVAKIKKKEIETFKKDLIKKSGYGIEFYSPKIEYHQFFKNKTRRLEKLALENYVFCYSKNFNSSVFLNKLKFTKGLEYFLNGYYENQDEMINFIQYCKCSENDKGYLSQSFFKTTITNKAKFISGPFTDMIFEIIKRQKNKLKIIVGNVVMTVSDNSNYLYRPA
tara:strand:- start:6140 stop:6640 length:501 start_codon:yes stop_codon:yes gene_type:complete